MGKGADEERAISKYLTEYVSGKSKPYIFWRSPGSGSLGSAPSISLSEHNKDLSGDIIALRPEGSFLVDRFSIEIKNGYSQYDFHKHLKNRKSTEVEDFWKQCCKAASGAKKYPMLIFRKKGFNEIVGISIKTPKLLDLISSKYIQVGFNDEDLPDIRFYDLKTFFENIRPEDIKKIKCLV